MKAAFSTRQTARTLFVTVLAFGLAPWAAAEDVRVGVIEIGGSGLKEPKIYVIKDTPRDNPPQLDVDILPRLGKFNWYKPPVRKRPQLTTGVSESSNYDQDEIRKLAEAIEEYVVGMVKTEKISENRIWIFGSSGLPRARNLCQLKDEVEKRTRPFHIGMDIITCEQEVQWTRVGLEPNRAFRQHVLFVDVGSGNTKGGSVDAHGEPNDFCIELGSSTYRDEVVKRAPGQPFLKAETEHRPKLLKNRLTEKIDQHPTLQERPCVYLSGGAVFATVEFKYRGMKDMGNTTLLTVEDIQKYSTWLRDEYVKLPNEELVKSESERLIAGAEILNTLSAIFNFQNKHLIFDRDKSKDPWIKGAIIYKLHAVYPSPQSPAPSWPKACIAPAPSSVGPFTDLGPASGTESIVPGGAVLIWPGNSEASGQCEIVARSRLWPHLRLQRRDARAAERDRQAAGSECGPTAGVSSIFRGGLHHECGSR